MAELEFFRALLDKTNTPLVAGGNYTSEAHDVTNYRYIKGRVYADQDGTLEIFEKDEQDATWDIVDTISYTANTVLTFKHELFLSHVQIKFTSGSALSDQTVFRFSTYVEFT